MKKFRYDIYINNVIVSTINAVDKISLKEELCKMGYKVVNSFVTKRDNDFWEGNIVLENGSSLNYKRYKN